uniref:Uncharacterized protein n=1 Tax=Anguilla anguilla TaxID=7936 RepID=A0A0E9TMK0_ANGAN
MIETILTEEGIPASCFGVI